MRDLRRGLSLELHRHRRGDDLPELVKTCDRMLAVLGLLPPGRPPPRGAVAAVDRRDRRGRGGAACPGPLGLLGDVLEDQRGPPAHGLGAVVESYAVRARGRIDDAQDGGGVSALLIGLLAAGEIDGVLCRSRAPTRPAVEGRRHRRDDGRRDPGRLGQLLQPDDGTGPSSTSRATGCHRPRIAVVGTPCEVQGLRAMQARRWPTGVDRVDVVVSTIARMCTKNFDDEALTLRELRDKRGVDLDRGLEDGRDPGAHDRRVPRTESWPSTSRSRIFTVPR